VDGDLSVGDALPQSFAGNFVPIEAGTTDLLFDAVGLTSVSLLERDESVFIHGSRVALIIITHSDSLCRTQ
jgi:hypothetical protein